jgi:hypothetical protein
LVYGYDRPKVRGDIFSTTTATQQTIHLFRTAETDEQKALIFKRTIKIWRPIIPEVKAWLSENLWKWEAENPDWFSARFIDKIPAAVMDKEDIERMIRQGKRKGRKSSIVESGSRAINGIRLALG